MTSRITGSTGGVSHRLYLPPSERAAHELAAATAAAMAASGGMGMGMSVGSARPSTGTGARPASGYSYPHQQRPGTSNSNQAQRASAAGVNGVAGGARPPSAAVTLVGSSASGTSGGAAAAASGSSAFGTQLSAMSFKSSRAILDELQRVLSANGLQWSVLPPSGPAAAATGHPSSPLGPKHGFVPASIGAAAPVSSAGGSLAPISISSLRPHAHAADGVSASASSSQVLECRQGGNRFQFHIAPLTTTAARLALDLDETAGGASPAHSYSIRVKRVLGDAHTFRDLCAKLLPQLKL